MSLTVKRVLLGLVALSMLVFPAVATAAPPPLGALTPLPGTTGCFATAASASCQAANGIFAAESATVSPDGRFVHAGSYEIGSNGGPGLAAFPGAP